MHASCLYTQARRNEKSYGISLSVCLHMHVRYIIVMPIGLLGMIPLHLVRRSSLLFQAKKACTR